MPREVGWDWPKFSGFKPLNTDDQEIRILTILPGTDEICCTIQHWSLKYLDHGYGNDYFALSYAWGTAGEMIAAQLDNEQVMLRRTVWALLSTMRQRANGEPCRVWLDILCINQRDLDEKTNQINHMGKIFGFAQGTIAWLGEADSLTNIGFDFLDFVARHAHDENSKAGPEPRAPFIYFMDLCEDKYELYAAGLAAIVKRGYWERVWILQELARTMNVTLLCGARSHPYISIVQLCKSSVRQRSLLEKIFPATFSRQKRLGRLIHNVADLFYVKTPSGAISWISLYELIKLSADSKSTDPKDMVFAIALLARADQSFKIKIDYRSATIDVFEAALKVALSDDVYPWQVRQMSQLWKRMKLGSPGKILNESALSKLQEVLDFRIRVCFVQVVHAVTIDTVDDGEQTHESASIQFEDRENLGETDPRMYQSDISVQHRDLCISLEEHCRGWGYEAFVFRFDKARACYDFVDYGVFYAHEAAILLDSIEMGERVTQFKQQRLDRVQCPPPSIQVTLELPNDFGSGEEADLSQLSASKFLVPIYVRPSYGAMLFLMSRQFGNTEIDDRLSKLRRDSF